MKIRELRKLISGFGCKLIQNHKGHPEENAHLERSHRTDDEEFYIPRVLKIRSEKDLLDEALGYIYYYNNVREHSSLNYQTPYRYLKKQLPDVDSSIRFVIPIMLDKVSVQIGRWSGYHVLAQYLCALSRTYYTIFKLWIFSPLLLWLKFMILTKFSPLQNLKVSIYKGFVILGR